MDLDWRVQLLLVANVLVALTGGALLTPLVFWSKGRLPASGFFAGVLAGVTGNLLFLIPLWFFLRRKEHLLITTEFNIDTAYKLGVAAVSGNRLEEARYYFVQVTQVNPQHVGAWLYLANVATTPLEAWSYIQQARAIAPEDPIVREAVAYVWPQVQPLYGDQVSSAPAIGSGYTVPGPASAYGPRF